MAGRIHLARLLIVLSLFICAAVAKNKACAQYEGDGGLVCVCNSTYCDSVAIPTELKSGKYYHYSTAEDAPGFTMKKGSFSKKKLETATSDKSSVDYTITVDPSTTYQTLRGIGAGISDSAAYVYSSLSTKTQEYLIESAFGDTGAEFTFGRIPLGPTDFSLSYYSYDDTVGDTDMKDFALTDYEISTKIPMINKAISASSRGMSLLATPWTPPSWLKDNNDTEPGFLMPEYKEAYANYIVKFFDAYKEQGLSFWGLSEGNEVIMGYNMDFSMPNVLLFPNELRDFTKTYLGPALEAAGYSNMTIITLDDERSYLPWYSDRLMADDEAAAYIDGFAVHWYYDYADNYYVLDDFHTNYPDKFLIQTEAAGGGGGMKSTRTGSDSDIALGDWSEAEEYITDIFQNYQHWVEGYITWNLCLNLEGGPYQQMPLGAPFLVDTDNDLFYKQPSFYAFAHFSKFMYPGSVRIDLTVSDNSNSLYFPGPNNPTQNPGPGPNNPTGNPGPSGGPGPNNPTGNPGPSGGPGPNNPTGNPGPGPSGGPGPNPSGGGGGGGGGGRTTEAPEAIVFDGIASTNPDGSTTVILFNPTDDKVTINLVDTDKGTISTTLPANSLNTFMYW